MEAIDHLLECARKGESEALSQLYRRFVSGVFGYIAARVSDRSTAEDLTSDVFVAMIENIYRLRATNEIGFVAWLLQIARVTVAGYYRNQEKQPNLLSLESSLDDEAQTFRPTLRVRLQTDDPARQVEIRDDWQQTVQAINSLTEEQRQVLVGRLILGYDIATVAQMIGKKANAVKALQFRALHSLERLLSKRLGAENARRLYEEKIQ